jgi:hypothetical protein
VSVRSLVGINLIPTIYEPADGPLKVEIKIIEANYLVLLFGMASCLF